MGVERIFKFLKFIFLITVGFLAGIFILIGLPLYFKLGVFIFFAVIISFLLSPFKTVLFLIFIRPLVDLFANIYFTANINFLGFFSGLYILFFIILALTRENIVLFPKNIRLFYVFIFATFINLPVAVDSVKSIFFILRFISLLSIYLLTYNLITTKEDVLKVIKTVVASSTIPLLFGFYQYFTGGGHTLTGFQRINSLFYHPNTYAFYLIIILFSIGYLSYWSGGEKAKKSWLLLIIPVLLSLIMTYTRGAWIGLICGISVVSIFEKKTRRIFFLSIIIIIVFFGPLISSRLDDLIHPPEYGISSWEFRVRHWEALLNKVVAKNMLLGYGAGASKEVAETYGLSAAIPHNDYIRLLIEFGILGTIPYIVFVIYTFGGFLNKIKAKINPEINTMMLGLFTAIFIATGADNLIYSITIFGYLFVLLAATHKLNLLENVSI